MKHNRGWMMVTALVVVVLVTALTGTWQPAPVYPAPPLVMNGPMPQVVSTPVAGSLAAMSVLLYVPVPDVYLPVVLMP